MYSKLAITYLGNYRRHPVYVQSIFPNNNCACMQTNAI